MFYLNIFRSRLSSGKGIIPSKYLYSTPINCLTLQPAFLVTPMLQFGACPQKYMENSYQEGCFFRSIPELAAKLLLTLKTKVAVSITKTMRTAVISLITIHYWVITLYNVTASLRCIDAYRYVLRCIMIDHDKNNRFSISFTSQIMIHRDIS